MEPNIGLNKSQRQHIADALCKLLSTTYALYLKTQNFHWNIVGPGFIALHKLFEEHYEEMAEAVDEMAERIRTLGFYAPGSFSYFSKHSLIADENEPLTYQEMLKKLVLDHEVLIRAVREALPFAEKAEDGATADFLNKRLAFHEKAAWMLRSHII